MAGTTWSKFYWSDWMSDPGLRRCSYAARGLWMDMLCLAATADPIGHLVINKQPLTARDIARMTGGDEPEVVPLIDELERNGVLSRQRNGVIYSRRMVSDAKKVSTARENGKNGGNPSLRKDKGIPLSDNLRVKPPDKPPDKGWLKPQKPEARSQKESSQPSRAPPAATERAMALRRAVGEMFARLAPDRPFPPETGLVEQWVADGISEKTIRMVLEEMIPKKPDMTSLRYVEKRLREVHAMAPKPRDPTAQPSAVTWDERKWRVAIDDARSSLVWARGVLGPRPGEDGCLVPIGLVTEEDRATSWRDPIWERAP